METLLQTHKSHPPTTSDPRESHLWVHPHNKVKKRSIQRYSNKSFITLRHIIVGAQGSLWFANTHSQNDFKGIRCQEAPVNSAVEIAEEHTFAQTGDREEPPVSSPEQKAKFSLAKISKAAAGYTSYTLMPVVFSVRISSCLKGISSVPANQCSQAYKNIHSKQAQGTWVAQMLLPKPGTW